MRNRRYMRGGMNKLYRSKSVWWLLREYARLQEARESNWEEGRPSKDLTGQLCMVDHALKKRGQTCHTLYRSKDKTAS